jgi:hypothetical protein
MPTPRRDLDLKHVAVRGPMRVLLDHARVVPKRVVTQHLPALDQADSSPKTVNRKNKYEYRYNER